MFNAELNSRATCSPKTVSSARRTPPGSCLASAAPEPHSRAGEPALCPQIAGSRSVNSGGLFHVEQKRRSRTQNINWAQAQAGVQVVNGTSWAQVSCIHITFGPRALLLFETPLPPHCICVIKNNFVVRCCIKKIRFFLKNKKHTN